MSCRHRICLTFVIHTDINRTRVNFTDILIALNGVIENMLYGRHYEIQTRLEHLESFMEALITLENVVLL